MYGVVVVDLHRENSSTHFAALDIAISSDT